MGHLVQGGNQLLVGVLQGLDIHNTPLGFLGRLDRAHLQGLGVLAQELIGHIADSPLGLNGLGGVGHTQGQHHLALPQGNGVHQSGLDFLRHDLIVILHQADLGAHLDADHPGQFQVVELLLKALAHSVHIVGRLGVLGEAGAFGLLHQGRQHFLLHLAQLALARQDIHGQFLEVAQVQVIHLIQNGDVLQQLNLVVLQDCGDLLHIDFYFIILGFHAGNFIPCFFEKAEEALFLFLNVEALELRHQAGNGVSDFPQVLGAHILQGRLRKPGNLLLGRRAVLHHLGRVGNINLFRKIRHSFLLLGRQGCLFQHHRLRLGGFFFQGQLRGGRGSVYGVHGQFDFFHLGNLLTFTFSIFFDKITFRL